jgi:hypothetical protein
MRWCSSELYTYRRDRKNDAISGDSSPARYADPHFEEGLMGIGIPSRMAVSEFV